jgi:uncharacterized repeat protein (TIGR03943 family)
MNVDWTRLLRALAVTAWAGFFDYLWLSGHATTYVGPRTEWVVTFGAITLTLVAVVLMAGVLRREPSAPPRAAEVGRLGIIVAPIVLAAMAPAVTLGAQAVDQKSSADGAASLSRLKDYDGDVRLYELAAAAYDREWGVARGIEPGLKVEFDGFVSRTARDGSIRVSRFMATCCAADAVPYSIDVEVPDGAAWEKNTWILVRGTVESTSDRPVYVVSDSVEEIERPIDAYGV